MKRNIINHSLLLLAFILGFNAFAQEKKSLSVALSFCTLNNNIPYVAINARAKIDGKLRAVPGITFKVFLDKDSNGNGLGLIGSATTNEQGKVALAIPPALSALWTAKPNHDFIATSAATKEFEESSTEISNTKSRLLIDTTDGRTVTATFSEFKDGAWVPMKDVEVKLAVKRQGGDLKIGEEETYTTDSLGQVSGEYKRDSLPGDAKGNIILIAKIEDNETYGSLRVEKNVNWGKPFVYDNNFFHRALWATRFHSPLWLVVIAYSIIAGVWGTVIYLIFIMIRIKKAGMMEQR
jgi:hypothetical protein